MDVAWISLYFPPENVGNHKPRSPFQKLLSWTSQILAGLPARVLPIVMMDGNGRVGMLAGPQGVPCPDD
eukprot:7894808-Pyramimonas_sp.AAC.1